jgi:DNA-binding winged helix-turn-helix (wHTH) protein
MIQRDPLPLTYRRNVVDQIMACIAAGDSCQVVGIGSVGKSNLLRFLQRPDVRQARLGQEGERALFVYVDANKLLKRSRWGLAELMLHQLVLEFSGQGAGAKVFQTLDEATGRAGAKEHQAPDELHGRAGAEALQALDELHGRATAPETSRLAMRYLDRAAALVCSQAGLRLVWLFDEFDGLVEKLPRQAFSALRALRDDYKGWLVYVVAARQELNRLGQKPDKIEAFEELISPRTIWLGPYGLEDAHLMVQRLAARSEVAVEGAVVEALLCATGGHPGLLKTGFSLIKEGPAGLPERLLSDGRVQDECLRIWRSLPRGDQEALARLARGEGRAALPAGAFERLARMGLVGGPWAEGEAVFSSILAETIRRIDPAVGKKIVVNEKSRTVWVGDRKLPPLSPLEFNLIAYLAARQGDVCSKNELIDHLYGDAIPSEKGVTDERLVTLVKRLRKSVEPDPKNPRYLITDRGVGFRLVADEGEQV